MELRPYQPDPPRVVRRTTPLEERLASAIDYRPGKCWEWRAARDGNGYGMVRVAGRTRRVHVVVYEILVGPLPGKAVLDHLCRNPPCCNPQHLDLVTHRINILRGEGLAAHQVLRTHCPRGHPYDEVNTYILPSRPTARYCKACNRINHREQRRRGTRA